MTGPHLQQALLGQVHGPLMVHVVAHTLGLAAVHGGVAAKAVFKLLLQIHHAAYTRQQKSDEFSSERQGRSRGPAQYAACDLQHESTAYRSLGQMMARTAAPASNPAIIHHPHPLS
jgi:predicted lipid-binding transport protein (Tim44 family)